MRPVLAAMAVLPLALVTARTAPAQRAPVTLEQEGEWGCLECTTGHQFGGITALAVTRSGAMHVIDRDEPRVRIFDAGGTLVHAFGRRGRGPGELEVPIGIAVASDGTLQVADLRNARLTRYGADGEVLGTVTLTALATAMASHPARDEIWLAFTNFRDGGSLERWARSDSAGTRLAELDDFPPSEGVPGTVESMAASPSGVLAIGDGRREYRIRLLGADGWAAGSDIVREIAKVEKTPEEIAEQEARMGQRGEQMRAALEGRQAGAGRDVRMPAVAPLRNHFNASALRYDDAGRLWVRTERGSDGRTTFDLFDPEGRFLGEVGIAAKVRLYDIAGEHLVAASEGPDGVPVLSLWRIRPR